MDVQDRIYLISSLYYTSRVECFLAMPMPTHGFQIAEADTHEAVYLSNTHLRVQAKRRRVYRSAGDWVDVVDYCLLGFGVSNPVCRKEVKLYGVVISVSYQGFAR